MQVLLVETKESQKGEERENGEERKKKKKKKSGSSDKEVMTGPKERNIRQGRNK